MQDEQLKALAGHDKPKAVEHMFNRLIWLKLHLVMERLDPPAEEGDTVSEVLTRAKEAGDNDADYLATDAGRETVMQEARDVVDKLLASDDIEMRD